MRVPNPEAQSRIDALNAELDQRTALIHRRALTIGDIQVEINVLRDEVSDLRRERDEIYETCERVEVDS